MQKSRCAQGRHTLERGGEAEVQLWQPAKGNAGGRQKGFPSFPTADGTKIPPQGFQGCGQQRP